MQKGRKTQRNLMNIRSVALICNTDMFLHILCIFLVRSLFDVSRFALLFPIRLIFFFTIFLFLFCFTIARTLALLVESNSTSGGDEE